MDVLTQVLGFRLFVFCLAQRVSVAALFTHPQRTALQCIYNKEIILSSPDEQSHMNNVMLLYALISQSNTLEIANVIFH